MREAVCYYRVSTIQQGKSGLGLEAQQKAVRDYIQAKGLTLLAEYTEVESSRKKRRPGLQAALTRCKTDDAILLIAKLDRLGRSVSFISALMESGAEFVALDIPYANKLILHIMAAFAEHERDMISTRTKEALQAAKRRGVILGRNGIENLSIKNRIAADQFAESLRPIIVELQSQKCRSAKKISVKLNEMKVPTYRGGNCKWHMTSVYNVIKRLQRRQNVPSREK